MTRKATGVYGGVPAEQRVARRREQLLEACLDSLGEIGWQRTSVRGICEGAGLNPRYFYESFSSLDELVVAVFDRIAEDAARSVEEALAQAPPTMSGQIGAIVRGFTVATTEDPRKARVAFVDALGSDALMRRRLDAIHAIAETIAAVALSFHDDLDPRVAAVNAQLLAGGVIQAIIAWIEGRLDIDREALIERCTTLVVASVAI
ncbi:MAG TPA: TetR/AcrR family transcriptional regulator [Solirubrobacterales bacterium]|nr:TetR/AcrR family transcriptional regulator [Solirubrobacterales bacterium]